MISLRILVSGRAGVSPFFGLLLSVLFLLLAASSVRAADARQALEPATPSVTGKLVVAFADSGQSEAEVTAELAAYGLTLEQWLPGLGLARALAPTGTGRAAADALSQSPGIAYVTDERRAVHIVETPQDEYWAGQWGPAKVALPAARDIAWGHPSVVTAVVDTGVRYTHWDLRDQMWINPGESGIDALNGKRTCSAGIALNGQDDDGNGYIDDCRGYNFDEGNQEPDDVHGHGTVVAGIAGAGTNNPGHYTDGRFEGIAGMGGAARIMPLRGLNAGGVGSAFNIAEAIQYAANMGAQVINLSLTLPPVSYDPADADTLCRATDYAQGKGSLVIGASGNHSSASSVQPVSYPARCPGVLAIGASTRGDTRAFFSNADNRLDLVAPGEGITSTLRTADTSYGLWNSTGSGTSFAAPHAAGAAGLVWSLRPDLAPAVIHELLRTTADDVGQSGYDALTGWGRLNAGRAVEVALDGLSLALTVEAPEAAGEGSVQLVVRVTGPEGAPAGFGARVTLESVGGSVWPDVVILDGAGTAVVTFTPVYGAAQVTARLGPLSASTRIGIMRPTYLPLIHQGP